MSVPILITIPRLIPAGGINKNHGLPYSNMEEKINEYVTESVKNNVCYLFRPNEPFHSMDAVSFVTNTMSDIIGRVVTVRKEDAVVEFADTEFYKLLKNPKLHIISIGEVHTNDGIILVDRIVRFEIMEDKND